MKITRNQISNLIFLLLIVMMLFTPVGKHVKIWVNRLLAFSPSVTAVENRKVLDNYHWELRSANGKPFHFEDARGKIIIVNFWATWCPPCIAEMPALQELYNDYKDKVVFIFATHERSDVINSFLTKNEYDLPVFNPVTGPPQTLTSKSIPATYLIDKKGEIIISKSGAANWNSKKVRTLIDKLLSE